MKIGDYEVTLGADPEMAVYNKTKKEYISPYLLMEGSKDKPVRVRNGAIQVDGFAAEFNIDPAEDMKTFVANIESVQKQLSKVLNRNAEGDEIILQPLARVIFPLAYFKKVPDWVKKVGCSPDYSSATGTELLSPVKDTDNIRYFGGHIHVGWGKVPDCMEAGHFADACFLAKNVHFVNTNNLFLVNREFRVANTNRAEVYGLGRLRPKVYGVELREMSNVWLDCPEFMREMYEMVTEAFKGCLKRETVKRFPGTCFRDNYNDRFIEGPAEPDEHNYDDEDEEEDQWDNDLMRVDEDEDNA